MSVIELRDYQEDALARVAAAEARGVRKQLGVAATGLGKTIMFCALARERGCRTLILAHRDELVSQAAAKVREVWPEVDVGIVKANDNDVTARVVVASVQTLSRQRRLDMLLGTTQDTGGMAGWGLTRPEPFGLVVVDEAHHTAAASYRTILDAMRAGESERDATPEEVDDGCELGIVPDGPLLLGVTATPDRGDGKGLDDLFDEIVFNFDILWGIRAGYLADVRALKVALDVDMSHVKTSRGDYEAGAMGRAMEAADASGRIVQAWKAHAADRRTLVFVPTVALSRETADLFNHHGIKAGHVSADTDLDDRRRILREYADGTLQVLCNCMVLTEGFDSPRTDCIIQARPTKSRALFTQIVGRGTRKHPDKADLLVLDVVGSSDEHSLVTVPSLFGLETEYAARMDGGALAATDVVQARDDWLASVGRMTAVQADMFRTMRAESTVAWVSVSAAGERARYQRTLGDKRAAVVLVQRDDQAWLCGLIAPDGAKRVLIDNVSLEMAQGVGEDTARKLGKKGIVDAGAAWRSKKPTPKQRAFAKRVGVEIPAGSKAGEVSDLIDAALARRGARRKTKAS